MRLLTTVTEVSVAGPSPAKPVKSLEFPVSQAPGLIFLILDHYHMPLASFSPSCAASTMLELALCKKE